MSRRGKSLFLEVPGQVDMSNNGKNKPLESKICVLGCAGVGKSGMRLYILFSFDSVLIILSVPHKEWYRLNTQTLKDFL